MMLAESKKLVFEPGLRSARLTIASYPVSLTVILTPAEAQHLGEILLDLPEFPPSLLVYPATELVATTRLTHGAVLRVWAEWREEERLVGLALEKELSADGFGILAARVWLSLSEAEELGAALSAWGGGEDE